jgi:hypothetical protein
MKYLLTIIVFFVGCESRPTTEKHHASDTDSRSIVSDPSDKPFADSALIMKKRSSGVQFIPIDSLHHFYKDSSGVIKFRIDTTTTTFGIFMDSAVILPHIDISENWDVIWFRREEPNPYRFYYRKEGSKLKIIGDTARLIKDMIDAYMLHTGPVVIINVQGDTFHVYAPDTVRLQLANPDVIYSRLHL